MCSACAGIPTNGSPSARFTLSANQYTIEYSNPSADKPVLIIETDVKNAEVHINGIPYGKSPLETSDISLGSHLIEINATGYLIFTQWIDVQPGTTEVTVELHRLGAHFSIHTNPAKLAHATIEIAGIGPYESGMFLPAGTHTLKLRAFGYHPVQHVFSITDGADKAIEIELEPADFMVTNAELARSSTGMNDWSALALNRVYIEASAAGSAEIYSASAQQQKTTIEITEPQTGYTLPAVTADTTYTIADANTKTVLASAALPGIRRYHAAGTAPLHSMLHTGIGSVRPRHSISTAIFLQYNHENNVGTYHYSFAYGLAPRTEIGIHGSLSNDSEESYRGGLAVKTVTLDVAPGTAGAVQSAVTARFGLPDNRIVIQLPITASWGRRSVFSAVTFEPEAAVPVSKREDFQLDLNTSLQLRFGFLAAGFSASLSGRTGGELLVAVPAGISIGVIGLHLDGTQPGISLGLAY